jgi:class 3 adenylate cyclase
LQPVAESGPDHFWSLIDERLRPGADIEALDRRLWDLYGGDWSVMFTDLVGFSRRVAEFGIVHFLELIREHRRLVAPIVREHDGLLLKGEGDSLVMVFRRPARALACAIAMQHACQRLSVGRPPEKALQLCIGLGHGHVLLAGHDDVWGAEVNAAGKLGEDVARGEEILTTGSFLVPRRRHRRGGHRVRGPRARGSGIAPQLPRPVREGGLTPVP